MKAWMDVFGVVLSHDPFLDNSGILVLLGKSCLQAEEQSREHGLLDKTLKDRHARPWIQCGQWKVKHVYEDMQRTEETDEL
jgi:hypothetical protein